MRIALLVSGPSRHSLFEGSGFRKKQFSAAAAAPSSFAPCQSFHDLRPLETRTSHTRFQAKESGICRRKPSTEFLTSLRNYFLGGMTRTPNHACGCAADGLGNRLIGRPDCRVRLELRWGSLQTLACSDNYFWHFQKWEVMSLGETWV